jgi:hypothetical protein
VIHLKGGVIVFVILKKVVAKMLPLKRIAPLRIILKLPLTAA